MSPLTIRLRQPASAFNQATPLQHACIENTIGRLMPSVALAKSGKKRKSVTPEPCQEIKTPAITTSLPVLLCGGRGARNASDELLHRSSSTLHALRKLGPLTPLRFRLSLMIFCPLRFNLLWDLFPDRWQYSPPAAQQWCCWSSGRPGKGISFTQAKIGDPKHAVLAEPFRGTVPSEVQRPLDLRRNAQRIP